MLILVNMWSGGVMAATLTTKTSTLPQKTATTTAAVNTVNGRKTYTIWNQSTLTGAKWKMKVRAGNRTYTLNQYFPRHGCASCTTTSIVRAWGDAKYKNITPLDMSKPGGIEEKALGQKLYQNNYAKTNESKPMPITIPAMSKILTYCGVRNTLVRSYSRASAKKQITGNLNQGKPVIIEVRQYNSAKRRKDSRWTTGYHTMALLGFTEKGKVIVADPSGGNGYKSWSGGWQRIKLVSLDEILNYMYSANTTKTPMYFSGSTYCGGYILVR